MGRGRGFGRGPGSGPGPGVSEEAGRRGPNRGLYADGPGAARPESGKARVVAGPLVGRAGCARARVSGRWCRLWPITSGRAGEPATKAPGTSHRRDGAVPTTTDPAHPFVFIPVYRDKYEGMRGRASAPGKGAHVGDDRALSVTDLPSPSRDCTSFPQEASHLPAEAHPRVGRCLSAGHQAPRPPSRPPHEAPAPASAVPYAPIRRIRNSGRQLDPRGPRDRPVPARASPRKLPVPGVPEAATACPGRLRDAWDGRSPIGPAGTFRVPR